MKKIAEKIESGKANRFYILLDVKGENSALTKVGITEDTLKNRMHTYRTANPLVVLVATAEVRCNQNLHEVEDMFFDFMRKEKGYDHIFGEWVQITSKEDIDAIVEYGFRFFGNLFYRTKKQTFYNRPVCELWESRKR